MNNILVLPMVIPILAGDDSCIFFVRTFNFSGGLVLDNGWNGIISLYILNRIQTEGILHLDFGGWDHRMEFYLSQIHSRCYLF